MHDTQCLTAHESDEAVNDAFKKKQPPLSRRNHGRLKSKHITEQKEISAGNHITPDQERKAQGIQSESIVQEESNAPLS